MQSGVRTKRRATRKKPGQNLLFEVGKEGRRTGIRPPTVNKDEDNLDNIDEFFASDSEGDDVDLDGAYHACASCCV